MVADARAVPKPQVGEVRVLTERMYWPKEGVLFNVNEPRSLHVLFDIAPFAEGVATSISNPSQKLSPLSVDMVLRQPAKRIGLDTVLHDFDPAAGTRVLERSTEELLPVCYYAVHISNVDVLKVVRIIRPVLRDVGDVEEAVQWRVDWLNGTKIHSKHRDVWIAISHINRPSSGAVTNVEYVGWSGADRGTVELAVECE